MKRFGLLKSGIAAAILTMVLPGIAAAENVKLKIANWVPPAHHMTITLRAWADELQKASNGEIEVEIMTSPLAKPNEQYDLAKDNLVDISWSVAGHQPERFWRLMAAETPFSAPTAETAGVAAWRWYERTGFMAEETKGTKLLTLFAHAPHLYHSSKTLTSMADFKDKKIRVGGHGVHIAKALGGVPVVLNPLHANEAMSKNTIEISQFPWESVKGFELADVASHHLKVPGGTYAGILLLTMSPKTWDNLSDSHKAAVTKVSGEWGSRFISQRWDAADHVGRDAALEAGNTITIMSDEETAKLKDMVQHITDEWIAKANDAGLDGAALIKQHRDIVSGL